MTHVILVICILAGAVFALGATFWQHEMKYQLPTPVPDHYNTVPVGSPVANFPLPAGQAYFLHFYNPDCPCSRFNAKHVRSLIRAYGDSVAMYIVVQSTHDMKKAEREFAGQSFLLDGKGELARACGVYATPQAAIVSASGGLYYRGNYNRTRYCTAKATNFAELSLIALMKHQPPPAWGMLATQAYGCSINEDSVLY